MDIYEIRLENLEKILAEDFSGNKSKLAELLGRQPSSISRYWSKSKDNYRRIENDAAREIEQKTGRTKHWMDTRHTSVSYQNGENDINQLIEYFQNSDSSGKKHILSTAKHEATRNNPFDSMPCNQDKPVMGAKSIESKKKNKTPARKR
jgi:ABC-type antimicrobial peptide transport system permease subunit